MNTNIRNEEDDAPESELSTAKRMTASSSSSAENGLTHYTFPRTGKRGVPQQFPRRLYEMLEAEEDHFEASADHPRVICWSESGRAFRIHDVSAFSTTILPLYFRTKKFSSFQRNLNLVRTAFKRRALTHRLHRYSQAYIALLPCSMDSRRSDVVQRRICTLTKPFVATSRNPL